MRDVLAKWVSDADALHHVERFGFTQTPLQLSYVRTRNDDYYISLVGELFERLRDEYEHATDWSRLGNAITLAGGVGRGTQARDRIDQSEAALLAAAAFYFGGYPASAYLTLKAVSSLPSEGVLLACYELLARPSHPRSNEVQSLVEAVREGTLEAISTAVETSADSEAAALRGGPSEWIGWRLYRQMAARFARTNIRAVLPDGESEFWTPLVQSFLSRTPPAWDFFPSQIDAIQNGLLESDVSFSIQMPTGAGKTALSETLLFYHLTKNPKDAAILLVPFRSLAAELRGSLVKSLGRMGLPARCAYGGTVPTGDEVRDLTNTRAIVATPEALSGLLSADPEFFNRVSLVICDEGHLLDGQARGVGLELLLARMRARETGSPRFVFVSAIVPNIDEINEWLGGTADSVVRSDYRPAMAEFSVLRVSGKNADTQVDLVLHPHDQRSAFSVERFLARSDFQYRNASTGRLKTYTFSSVKTQAIAAARKALPMGAVAIFAANKRGNQGAVGLADELLKQLDVPLLLPKPIQYVADRNKLDTVVEYLETEYGSSWIGTRTLACGAVLHHGDIPQESREVLEQLLRNEDVRVAICTSTLAEGVNLPIRTLVLYSVQRRNQGGRLENLLARDIKNLVGRAGRAGSTTKGLVICANPDQWPLVEPVALQEPGERVAGALLELMGRLRAALSQQSLTLTNAILETVTELHTLVDGIDATLIDLAAEELGEEELVQIAGRIAGQTFAARQADTDTALLMREVFQLRAKRVAELQNAGRLNWIRETGTRARILESVETDLLPARERWDDIESPNDPELIEAMLAWAWDLPEIEEALNEAYREAPPSQSDFTRVITEWINGQTLVTLAQQAGLDIDTMLRVHARVIAYSLQVAIEQGVALLQKLLQAEGLEPAQAVLDFPEHVRFGVPTASACTLATAGIRHRRAAARLGQSPELLMFTGGDRLSILVTTQRLLGDQERWLQELGHVVLQNTIVDVDNAVRQEIES